MEKKKYSKPIIKILGFITSKEIVQYGEGFVLCKKVTDKIQFKQEKL